jgi:hypothetical protein
MGLADPPKLFHLFRHAFKDAAQNSDVERSKYDELQGHRDGTASSGYAVGSNIEALDRAIRTIRFESLDLPHLFVR